MSSCYGMSPNLIRSYDHSGKATSASKKLFILRNVTFYFPVLYIRDIISYIIMSHKADTGLYKILLTSIRKINTNLYQYLYL
jgi:hypothetical protein